MPLQIPLVVAVVVAVFKDRTDLLAENVALRHQLSRLNHRRKRAQDPGGRWSGTGGGPSRQSPKRSPKLCVMTFGTLGSATSTPLGLLKYPGRRRA